MSIDDFKAKISGIPGWCRWLALALLIFCLGFGCGYYRAWDQLRDQREAINDVERRLEQAQSYQRAATAEIGKADSAAQSAADAVKRSQGITADIREELQKAKENSTKASGSLTNANQSLTAWSAEQKRTRLRIKRQRNAWEAIAAGALVAWAAR